MRWLRVGNGCPGRRRTNGSCTDALRWFLLTHLRVAYRLDAAMMRSALFSRAEPAVSRGRRATADAGLRRAR